MNKDNYRIVTLLPEQEQWIDEAAEILVKAFPQAWPDMEAGRKEVRESFDPDRFTLAYIDENNNLAGWIGAINTYKNNITWELHPLVVKEEYRGKKIGEILVKELEKAVKEKGGMNIYLGTDDEFGDTSISGIDLYPGVLEKAAKIKNINRHPFEFYQKMGYEIVGVIPDAGGFGKPDIIMAKRLTILQKIESE